ncbi:MAG: hypothetical protein JST79_20635 [Acidobacteria bacterium]|nr:hypothetical protein [Acidobacteriota bacterium]
MRPRDSKIAARLQKVLGDFDLKKRRLPGISNTESRTVFVEQLLESIHRVKYVAVIRARDLSRLRMDPNNDLFDPLKASILHQRTGDTEEAFWLIFLFVHFGKHARAPWRYVREIYGRLGHKKIWNWANISNNPTGFRDWLGKNQEYIQRPGGGFGNHRKYESLDAYSSNGTGAVVESYIHWVNPPHTHQELMANALKHANGDPGKAFDYLYKSMESVKRFGRTARFDYLTMLGKTELINIRPPRAYLNTATGPLKGARLLFGDNQNAPVLDEWLCELDNDLEVGMQVLEDALCNWQKSPAKFEPFRG